MAEIINGVNWIAVIVGTAASFLLGWLWFSSRLFGKKWAQGNGLDLVSAQEMPMAAMGAQAIGLFLMSWFVGVTAANNALLTVILATVAFTVLAYSGGMFAKKNGYVRGVDAGYLIAVLVVMVICQGAF